MLIPITSPEFIIDIEDPTKIIDSVEHPNALRIFACKYQFGILHDIDPNLMSSPTDYIYILDNNRGFILSNVYLNYLKNIRRNRSIFKKRKQVVDFIVQQLIDGGECICSTSGIGVNLPLATNDPLIGEIRTQLQHKIDQDFELNAGTIRFATGPKYIHFLLHRNAIYKHETNKIRANY